MKWVKAALKYVLLAGMLYFFGRTLMLSVPFSEAHTPVIYYLEGQGMTLDQLDEMREDEQALDDAVPFASYSRMEDQTFVNPDLGKSVTCLCMYLFGDSSLVLTASGELFADDTRGCLLSSAAAWELFGETFVSGGYVEYQNKMYTVRGIYEDETPVIVISAPRQKEKRQPATEALDIDASYEPGTESGDGAQVLFDRILIRPSEDPARRIEQIHAFENRHGLGQNKTDCNIYVRLGNVLTHLLGLIVFVIMIWLVIRTVLCFRRRPFWLLLAALSGAAVFYLFFTLFRIQPQIPVDLVPNRWSDFDFWGEKITLLISSVRHMFFAEKTEVELIYFKPLIDMAAYSLLSIIMFLVCDLWFRQESAEGGSFPVMIMLSCVTEIIVMYMILKNGDMMAHRQMFTYLWPYLLGIRFIFGKNGLFDTKNIDFGK